MFFRERAGPFGPVGSEGYLVFRVSRYGSPMLIDQTFTPRIPKRHSPKRLESTKPQDYVHDPPSLHEKHRNAEIAKIQGNRNPFIDHPEWARDFQP